MEEANVVAYKVISDVAAFSDDVGRPRYIYGITRQGIDELDPQDVGRDRIFGRRMDGEPRATLVHETARSPTRTQDTGVRPPE
jgi:hypothetical protein